MDNRTLEELENKASNIITQDWHTREDVKVLSQIRFFMSKYYKDYMKNWSSNEVSYNTTRASRSVILQEEMAVGKAENIAKSEAEQEYWTYRQENALASGVAKIISSLDGFIITIQSELKSLDNVQY